MAADRLLGPKSLRNRLRDGHGADLIVIGLALSLPPLVVLAPLGMAPLLALAAIAVVAVAAKSIVQTLPRFAVIALLLVALGGWGAASALWSIIPGHSLFEGIRFIGESAGGICLLVASTRIEPAARARLGRALAGGIVVALALLLMERFANAPIMHWWHGSAPDRFETLAHYDRGITVLVLLMAPVAIETAAAWLRAALIAAIVATAALMLSASALMAAVVALIVYAIARISPRFTAGALMAGIVVIGIAIPLATPSYERVQMLHAEAPWIKWSGIHRLLIWRFAADHVAERPMLGWGMDASRAIPGGKTDFNDILPTLHYPSNAEALPLHPHDAAMQWQLELGVPGLALGLAIVVFVLYRIGWRDVLPAHERAAALALCSSAIIVALLSFGIWQAWWQSTLWLVAALYAANAPAESKPNRLAAKS
ncbi:MAG TPA: O-antigen ligase family protein [Stellaceae bacterium]|nr:O-antigen ligase family protein [Stellaceae bacterium]